MLIFLWRKSQVVFSLVAGETLPGWLNNTTGYSRTNGVHMIVHFSGLVTNSVRRRQKERRLKNDDWRTTWRLARVVKKAEEGCPSTVPLTLKQHYTDTKQDVPRNIQVAGRHCLLMTSFKNLRNQPRLGETSLRTNPSWLHQVTWYLVCVKWYVCVYFKLKTIHYSWRIKW